MNMIDWLPLVHGIYTSGALIHAVDARATSIRFSAVANGNTN